MAVTAAQLATKVVQHLGLLQAGQTINSDDSTLIQAVYTSVYLELQADHAVDWGPDENIPDIHALNIRDIVAYRVAGEFDQEPNLNEYTLAMRGLKKALAIDDPGEPVKACYY